MALATGNERTLTEQVIRVLIVEDDEKDFDLLRHAFGEIPGTCFALQWAETFEAGSNVIASESHDLYLFDYQLGTHTALDLLKLSHPLRCDPVIILLTGQEDREVDLQAIRLGASDYVLKPTLSGGSLDRTLRYALERKRLRQERDDVTAQLVQTSRRVGMADVASSVLHNVGNVLNSINISAGVVGATIRQLSLENVTRTAFMLEEHGDDVGKFLTQDPKGKLIPQYLTDLGKQLIIERTMLLNEVDHLTHNIEHIKQIITAQQGLARSGGMVERTMVVELVEQAVTLTFLPEDYERIHVIRQYQEFPPLQMDRHQVLQILINLIRNAIDAMKTYVSNSLVLTLGLSFDEAEDKNTWVKITISDSGPGIAPEHLSRIFSQGFTTKKKGHGFGLHSAAVSAKSMDGSLTVASEETGTTFTLDLPSRREGVFV